MKPSKKNCYLIAFLCVALSVALAVKTPLFIELLEAKAFDFRLMLRGERDPGKDIVIVAIDDESLKKVGRWPWSRDKFATLIEKISEGGAKTIGVDVLFAEPQITETSKVIDAIKRDYGRLKTRDRVFEQSLARRAEEDNVDARLANSIEKAGNVILGFVMDVPTIYEETTLSEIPDPIYDYPFMIVREGVFNRPIVANRAIIPIEVLISSAQSMGHAYTYYERDGAIRWEPLYVKLEEFYYPSFGIEVVRHYLGLERDELSLTLGEGLMMGESFVPTDESGRALINYAGRTGTFPAYSASDLLDGKLAAGALKGRIVLVGATAFGTTDTHITPFAQLHGIEKQATVVENLLKNNFLHKEEGTKLLEMCTIIVCGLIMGLGLPRLRAGGGVLLSALLLIVYLFLIQYLLIRYRLWMGLLTPSFNIFLLYSTITTYRFFTEERKAKDIRNMFSSYVTERVVNELVEHPEMAKLGGHRSTVTVLFSDIRGFTTYSEKRSPEEVVPILNEYLAEMTKVVFRWDGTLDKFVGDEIMAFWGEPLPQEDHAELAVRCALNMMDRLAELQEKWKAEGKEPLDIGIGVNSGEVLIGNIGAEGKKMDYTIIGDHVNLGARVEALTRVYNDHILITEFTYDRIKHLLATGDQHKGPGDLKRDLIAHARFKKIEPVKVKGKERSVMIYEITGLKSSRVKS